MADHHLQPPTKLPRISPSDDDASNNNNNTGIATMATSSSPLLNLTLNAASSPSKPLFTFMQLQELEHQALIYKYMAAGLPVPVHLILPIWKTIATSSFGPYNFPSLMGYASLCMDYKSSMEPEPGRCRRTDGKKWRCSRDVVPEHKYCERHVHRGRNRSRKPVETVAASPQTTELVGSDEAAGIPSAMAVSGARGVLKLLPLSGSSSRNASLSPPRLGLSPDTVLSSENGCKTSALCDNVFIQ